MFGLAAPVWLAALAALAVPIAIHLWTRRPARVVRVASIRHIAGAPVRARRLRLDDPWLLLVRVAVLTLVVVILARPYLARAGGPAPETWVLVDPALLRRSALDSSAAAPGSALDDAGRVLDSLRRAGAPIRLFAPGLPEVAWDADAGVDTTELADAWSLLREAEHLAPAGTKLLIVAEPRLAADAGERPEIGLNVAWGVNRTARRLDGEQGGWAGGRVGGSAARRTAVVFAGAERTDDARYIAAAIEAAADGSLAAEGVRVLPVDSVDVVAAGSGPGDWIVWLAADSMPDPLTRALGAGATVLTDGGGPAGDATRALLLSDGMPPVAVQHSVATDDTAAALGSAAEVAVLWETAAGAPLLTARRVGAGLHLVYAGRFDAASTDLVLQPAFPELIARLWTPADALRPELVPVSVRQILPVHAASTPGATSAGGTRASSMSAPAQRRDLTGMLWPVALALLTAERLLAVRRRRPRAAAAG